MPTIIGCEGGRELPKRGTAGQFLKKKTDSDSDFHCEWGDAGSASSDKPVEVNVTMYTNSVSSGKITAYRIGNRIIANAANISVKPPKMPPFTKLCTIDKISGFTFMKSQSTFVVFAVGDGKYDGYGLVLADVDPDTHAFSIIILDDSRATLYGVNFSITIPLIEDAPIIGV